MSRVISQRTAFLWVAYAFLIAMAGTTLPTPLYPLYQERFGWGELLITVIFAVYALGVIAGLVLTGRLSDEIGRRPVLFFGLGCAAISAVLFIVTQSLAPVLVARVLSGLSAGAFAGTATATLLDLGKRDSAPGVAVAVNLGGLGCGTLLAGALAEVASDPLRLPYWAHLVLLVPAVLGVLLVPEPVERSEHPRFAPQNLAVPAEVRGTFVRAVLGGFSAFAISGLFGAVGPSFLGKYLGYHSPLLAGALVFWLFLGSATSQLAVRRVSEHVALIGGDVVVVVAAALTIAALQSESLAMLILAGVAAGVGQGLAVGGGVAAVGAESPPERRGEVSASFFVVLYVGLGLPVVGVGLLAQATGLRAAGVALGVTVALLAAAGAVSLALRGRRPAVSGASSGRGRS